MHPLTKPPNHEAMAAQHANLRPEQVAAAERDLGVPIDDASFAVMAIFPRLGANDLAAALQQGYGARDTATWATPMANAIRSAGFGEAATEAALKSVFARITMEQLAFALKDAFTLTPSQLTELLAADACTRTAAILTGAFTPPPGPAKIVSLLRAHLSGSATPNDIAAALAGAFTHPPISATVLMQAIHDAYQTPAPPITDDALAAAVVFALNARPIVPGDVAAALRTVDASITMQGVAQALVAAYAPPPLSIVPLAVGTALVEAFADGATPAAVSIALVASFPDLDANHLATTLVQLYKLGIPDVVTLLDALWKGWNGDPAHIDAPTAAIAVQRALALPLTDATLLAAPLARQFALLRTPNDVAALGVAFFRAGYALDVTTVAFKDLFVPWNGVAFGRLFSVFHRPEWGVAIELQVQGETVIEAAPRIRQQIRQQFSDLTSSDMALVLASVFGLTAASAGVTPVAEAMKAAAYPLDETSLGMSQFYTPWTAADFGQVFKVYQSLMKGREEHIMEIETKAGDGGGRTASSTRSAKEIVAEAFGAGATLIQGAVACFVGGLPVEECAPELYGQSQPKPSIDELATVLAAVWWAPISGGSQSITNALAACNAFTGPAITAAATAAMAQYHDVLVRKELNDTGAIPYVQDPGTAFTLSPDIIVAGTTQTGDPATAYGAATYGQDLSVDPTANQVNFIYLRAKNLFPDTEPPGTTIAAPQLVCYSTLGSLAFDSKNWQILTNVNGSQAVTVSAAQGGVMVGATPFQFTPVPQANDHYCLIGRVVTGFNPNPLPDTSTIAGGLSWLLTHPAFCWRNVNLIEAAALLDGVTASIHYRNADPEPRQFALVVDARNARGIRVGVTADASDLHVEETAISSDRQQVSTFVTLPGHFDGMLDVRMRSDAAIEPAPDTSIELRYYAILTPEHPGFTHTQDFARTGIASVASLPSDARPAFLGNYVFKVVP